MILDFHCAIIMAKRIHDDNIISIETQSNSSLMLFLANKFHSKYECKEVERVSNHNWTKVNRSITLNE